MKHIPKSVSCRLLLGVALGILRFKEFESSRIMMEPEDLDFEDFITKRQLPFTCGLILLKQESLLGQDFKALKRQTYVYTVTESQDIKDLKLTENCNIVAILGLGNSDRLSTYDSFVEQNFWRINLILIFPVRGFKIDDLKSLPGVTIWPKDVMFVDPDGKLIAEVSNSNCLYEEPNCFLKEKSLKVGFTNSLPYLRVQGWSDYLSNSKQYPTLHLNKSLEADKLDVIDGIEGEFLRFLVTGYNMKIALIAPSDMTYGYKEESGSWTGKFGLLARGEVDLIAGKNPGNYERLEIGNYLAQLYNSKFTLISRNPPLQVSWFGPFRPFSYVIWALLLGSLLFVGIPIFWISKIHTDVTRPSSKKKQTGLVFIPELMKLLIDQPILRTPEGPVALVVASWLLFALIFQSVYSSNLTARLSVPDKYKDVETMEDVWNFKRTLVTYKTGTVALYINMSTDPYVKRVREKLLLYTVNIANYSVAVHDDFRLVSTLDEVVFKLRIESIGRNPSDYHYSKEPLINVFCSWLTLKHLRLGPALNTAILRAEAMGLLEKWRSDSMITSKTDGTSVDMESDGCELCEDVQPKDATLMLRDLKGIFFLWSLGILLSAFGFLMEVFIPKSKRWNQDVDFGYLE